MTEEMDTNSKSSKLTELREHLRVVREPLIGVQLLRSECQSTECKLRSVRSGTRHRFHTRVRPLYLTGVVGDNEETYPDWEVVSITIVPDCFRISVYDERRDTNEEMIMGYEINGEKRNTDGQLMEFHFYGDWLYEAAYVFLEQEKRQ